MRALILMAFIGFASQSFAQYEAFDSIYTSKANRPSYTAASAGLNSISSSAKRNFEHELEIYNRNDDIKVSIKAEFFNEYAPETFGIDLNSKKAQDIVAVRGIQGLRDEIEEIIVSKILVKIMLDKTLETLAGENNCRSNEEKSRLADVIANKLDPQELMNFIALKSGLKSTRASGSKNILNQESSDRFNIAFQDSSISGRAALKQYLSYVFSEVVYHKIKTQTGGFITLTQEDIKLKSQRYKDFLQDLGSSLNEGVSFDATCTLFCHERKREKYEHGREIFQALKKEIEVESISLCGAKTGHAVTSTEQIHGSSRTIDRSPAGWFDIPPETSAVIANE